MGDLYDENKQNSELNRIDEATTKVSNNLSKSMDKAFNSMDGMIGFDSKTHIGHIPGTVENYHTYTDKGYSKAGKFESDTLGEQVIETTKNVVADSDAAYGKTKISEIGGMVGLGGGSTFGSKANLSGMYDKFSKEGWTSQRTGNVLKDYKANVSKTDDALKKLNINPNSLTNSRIDKAIKTGKLGDKNLGEAQVKLLQQKAYLNSKKAQAQNIANAKGHARTMGEAWSRQALEGSDIEAGYKATKSLYSTGKAARFMAKGSIGLTADVANGAIKVSRKAVVSGRNLVNERKIKKLDKLGGDHLSEKVKLLEKRQTLADKKIKISEKHSSFSDKVHLFAKNSIGANLMAVNKFALSKTIGKTKAWGKFSAKVLDPIRTKQQLAKLFLGELKTKLLNKKLFKVVRAPFSFASFIKSMIRKVILMVAGIFGVAILVYIVIFCAITAFNSDADSADSTNGTVNNSNLQNSIYEFYDYQRSFENNIYNYVPGEILAEKFVFNQEYKNEIGIPSTYEHILKPWELQEYVLPENEINSSGHATYGGIDSNKINAEGVRYETSTGDLAGFNLYHYFGASNFDYSSRFELVDAYGRGTGVYEEFNFYGEAGLSGDMGIQYETPAWTDIKTIPEGMAMYVDRINTFSSDGGRVIPTSNYYGSKRSEYEVYEDYMIEKMNYPKGTDTYEMGSIHDGVERFTSPEHRKGESEEHNINSLYRAVISAGYGITNNYNDLDYDEYNRYLRNLFLSVMGRTDFDIIVNYVNDSSRTFKYTAVTSDGIEHEVEFPMIYPQITININHRECGLYDIAHISYLMGYENIDKFLPNANTFEGWYKNTDTAIGEESENLTVALGMWELDDYTWEELYEDLILPSNMFGRALSTAEINDLMNKLLLENGAIPENMDEAIRLMMSLVGTPYQLGGKDPSKGSLDCSGYVNYVANQMGWWSGTKLIAGLESQGTYTAGNIDWNSVPIGSLVMKGDLSGGYDHIAFYIGVIDGVPTLAEAQGGNIGQVSLTDARKKSSYKYIATPSQYVE